MAKTAWYLWNRAKNSLWVFPTCLLLIVLVLTSLKISGTSIGIYHKFLYGDSVKDTSLILGEPRSIRSDEWLVNTQLTIAQDRAGYPRVNQNIGEGMDMTVIGDVPYREWSTVFKPQNLAFLVLPLEYAFALKWWLMFYLLVVAAYFLTLKLLPGRRFLASLFALAIGFSPFIFWWFLSSTIAAMAYGLMITIISMRIIDQQKIFWLKNPKLTNLAHGLVLAYLLTCFGILLYPPYQVPVAIAVALFIAGHLFNRRLNNHIGFKTLSKRLAVIAGGGALAATVLVTFIVTRLEPIKAINGTVYPGERIVTSDGLEPLRLFNGFLMPQLQYDNQAVQFFDNQSETSNFILLLPYLLLPGFALLAYQYKKTRRVDWRLLLLQLGALVLLARVFLPWGQEFYKLLYLHRVPHERLVIGFGLIGILQMLLLMKGMAIVKFKRYWPVLLYGLACLGIVIAIGFTIRGDYPGFISNPIKIVLLATVFCAIIALMLLKKSMVAMALLLAFSLFSVYKVNPLYRGLGIAAGSEVTQSMQEISSTGDTWVAMDNIVLENFGLMAGRDSVSGVNYYPNHKFWEKAGKENAGIYNRYAHIVFTSNQDLPGPLNLNQVDLFVAKLQCNSFVTAEVEYALSPSPLNLPCVKLQKTIKYPAFHFYLYQVTE